MSITLPITILIEGVVVLCYCFWQRKPLLPILMTSVAANIFTQSVLWMVLNIFFRYYLAALLISEVAIWLLEGVLLSMPDRNRLTFSSAMLLSFIMNIVSFGLGWFLPV